jgi:hypothetical protein
VDEQQPTNKGGRPPFEPTEEQRRIVNVMSAGGFQQLAIAYALGISDNTLRKYFADELAAGGSKAHAMVVGNLYRQATKDDPRATPAAIFWAKTRLGWKDTNSVELSGPDGGPIKQSIEIVFVGDDDDTPAS